MTRIPSDDRPLCRFHETQNAETQVQMSQMIVRCFWLTMWAVSVGALILVLFVS